MKGNRRLPDIEHVLAEHGLDRSKPPPGSLFFEMWDAVESIGEAAYELPYLQGILNGSLHPASYGAYNVADAFYCFRGARGYREAAGRAPSGSVLKRLLEKKHEGYERYNATFPGTWHLDGVASIRPPLAVEVYVQFEDTVTSLLDPVYCIVAMLPCEYLWYWLAHNMGTPRSGNLYADWITANDDPDGAYAMGNFLDVFESDHPAELEADKATWLYTFATYCEYAGFAAGTNATIEKPSRFGLRKPNNWSSRGWEKLAHLYDTFESAS